MKAKFQDLKNMLGETLSRIAGEKNPLETIAGAAVLLIAMYFFAWGVLTARTGGVSGYTLVANFAATGGIGRGADVAISGVKVGSVSETRLNQDDYSVDVVMTVGSSYRLPRDTVAAISTSGLIGDKYIALEVGSSKEFARDGDKLRTVPFKPIEEIIGDFIFKDRK